MLTRCAVHPASFPDPATRSFAKHGRNGRPYAGPDNGRPDHCCPDHGRADHCGPDHGRADHCRPDHCGPHHAGPDHSYPDHSCPNRYDLATYGGFTTAEYLTKLCSKRRVLAVISTVGLTLIQKPA